LEVNVRSLAIQNINPIPSQNNNAFREIMFVAKPILGVHFYEVRLLRSFIALGKLGRSRKASFVW
jgi:hypothetical protein